MIRSPAFVASTLGHFVVDLLSSQRSVILAIVSVPLALTNAMIGLISMVYTFSALALSAALRVAVGSNRDSLGGGRRHRLDGSAVRAGDDRARAVGGG